MNISTSINPKAVLTSAVTAASRALQGFHFYHTYHIYQTYQSDQIAQIDNSYIPTMRLHLRDLYLRLNQHRPLDRVRHRAMLHSPLGDLAQLGCVFPLGAEAHADLHA